MTKLSRDRSPSHTPVCTAGRGLLLGSVIKVKPDLPVHVWNDGYALRVRFDFEAVFRAGPEPEGAGEARADGMASYADERALPRGTPKICSFFKMFVT